MASDLRARRLTEAHRLAQARLGAQTVRAMLTIWPLLDPDNLDGTEERWLRAALPIIRGQRSTSARLAGNYLRVFRRLEIPVAGDVTSALAETIPESQVITSLHVTGPVAVKRHLTIVPLLTNAMEIGRTLSAAASMRHVLDGGRQTVLDTVNGDDRALGWARVASGRPCGFCAMLASRGPVYRQESVGFAAHDHCSCAAEPVYRQDAAWPPGSRRYQQLWNETKAAGLSGADARNAFRHAVETAA